MEMCQNKFFDGVFLIYMLMKEEASHVTRRVRMMAREDRIAGATAGGDRKSDMRFL